MTAARSLCLFWCVSALGAAACADRVAEGPPRASGYVEATDVRVAAKVGGRIHDVLVTEGARVTAGQTLATLDTTDADLRLRQLEAERSQADAQLRLLQAGSRREDVDHARAQAAAARADVQAAEVELEAATVDAARFAQLVERRAGTVKSRDDAEARRLAAAARLVSMRERVTVADAAVARVTAGPRQEELDGARGRLAAVSAAIAAVQSDIAEAVITAPTAGVVSSRLVEPGEVVAPRAPLLVLIDLDRAWATAYVDEPLIGGLRLDQAATVMTDGGASLPGRITAIASRAEFTPRNVQTASERARLVYRVTVQVDNREGILKPGMPVEVTWQAR